MYRWKITNIGLSTDWDRSGLELTRTLPDGVGWLRIRPVLDRTYGSDPFGSLVERVETVSLAGLNYKLGNKIKLSIKYRLDKTYCVESWVEKSTEHTSVLKNYWEVKYYDYCKKKEKKKKKKKRKRANVKTLNPNKQLITQIYD